MRLPPDAYPACSDVLAFPALAPRAFQMSSQLDRPTSLLCLDGPHRTLTDVMTYKAKIDRERELVLDKLAREAQEAGMGY